MSKKTYISLVITSVFFLVVAVGFVGFGLYKMFTDSAEPYTYMMCGVWVLIFLINILTLVSNVRSFKRAEILAMQMKMIDDFLNESVEAIENEQHPH